MQYLTQWKFKTLKFFLKNFLKKIKKTFKNLLTNKRFCVIIITEKKREVNEMNYTNLTPNKLRILAMLMENPNGVKLKQIVEMNGKWESCNIIDAGDLAYDGYITIDDNGMYKIKED